MKHEKYDPAVEVTPKKSFEPKWLNDEIEPCQFVLEHPVELKSSERSYYLEVGTVIMILGKTTPKTRRLK